jgi:endonuclease G
VVVLLVLVGVALYRQSREQPPAPENTGPTTAADASVHLALGNPSGATTDPANRDNYLMRKPYFALSYNDANGGPNWVSWRVTRNDLGSAERAEFAPDVTLPAGFKRVLSPWYSRSGFDRGHMCPRSDRSATAESATATFVMTNIVPQSPHLNQRAWNDLEEYCRTLVRSKRQTLYIIAGPHGKGGEGSAGRADTISNGRVAVPARCWKVVVVLDADGGEADDAARVGSNTRVIAVVMPNDQSVGHGWSKFRTSVREVESLTGYTFLDRVPKDVAGPLKEKVDAEHVPPPRERRSGD